MEENNNLRKENAKLRGMLKEQDELKKKYEELQKPELQIVWHPGILNARKYFGFMDLAENV